MQNACLAYVDEKHYCPHCQERLSCCNAPPFHVGDGLGWGTEVFFICLNDECSLFVNGWKYIEEQYGHFSSYRFMLIPGEKEGTAMMVGSKDAFKGSEVDPETIKRQNERYVKEKKFVAQLDTCVAEKNLAPILALLLDNAANREDKENAIELMAELNDLACIDPIRNHKFIDPAIESHANKVISQILHAHFTRECPFCAELIKSQAKICKHCSKEIG